LNYHLLYDRRSEPLACDVSINTEAIKKKAATAAAVSLEMYEGGTISQDTSTK